MSCIDVLLSSLHILIRRLHAVCQGAGNLCEGRCFAFDGSIMKITAAIQLNLPVITAQRRARVVHRHTQLPDIFMGLCNYHFKGCLCSMACLSRNQGLTRNAFNTGDIGVVQCVR